MISDSIISIAVLGMGEAGTLIATDLVSAGARVTGYDPRPVAGPAGVTICGSEADAVSDAEVVLSVNSMPDAPVALSNALPGLRPGSIFADLNTTSPSVKQDLAARLEGTDVEFCDVAMMASVPGRGLRVPMLVAGDGALRYERLMTPLGAHITVQSGGPGAATSRKLLRSVFYKSVASALVEALAAAEAAGCGDWLRGNITDTVTAWGPHTIERWLDGTYVHAKRRSQEMTAATQQLHDLGVHAYMASASRDQLSDLAARGTVAEPAVAATSHAVQVVGDD